MKKILSCVLFFALATACVSAASFDELGIRTRMGYNQSFQDGERLPDYAGFFADYAVLGIEATLFDNLSFVYEHNFTEITNGFWESIDELKLNYDYKNWSFSFGKMFNLMGGWEFDSDDIEVYSSSEFWNNMTTYTLGAQVSYNFENEMDQINFQVTTSPFRDIYDITGTTSRDLMGYHIMWYGEHDWFQTAYSANFMGYEKGKYLNFITLGNRFIIGNGYLDIDLTNRADMCNYKFFNDITAVADFRYRFGENDRVELGIKYTFDYNDYNNGNDADYVVVSGTKTHTVSARVDFKPIKNYPDLRLIGWWGEAFGHQTYSEGVLDYKFMTANIGINWNIDFLGMFGKN